MGSADGRPTWLALGRAPPGLRAPASHRHVRSSPGWSAPGSRRAPARHGPQRPVIGVVDATLAVRRPRACGSGRLLLGVYRSARSGWYIGAGLGRPRRLMTASRAATRRSSHRHRAHVLASAPLGGASASDVLRSRRPTSTGTSTHEPGRPGLWSRSDAAAGRGWRALRAADDLSTGSCRACRGRRPGCRGSRPGPGEGVSFTPRASRWSRATRSSRSFGSTYTPSGYSSVRRVELDLGEHLVGEAHRHHEARVAGGVAEVQQATLGQDDAPSARRGTRTRAPAA